MKEKGRQEGTNKMRRKEGAKLYLPFLPGAKCRQILHTAHSFGMLPLLQGYHAHFPTFTKENQACYMFHFQFLFNESNYPINSIFYLKVWLLNHTAVSHQPHSDFTHTYSLSLLLGSHSCYEALLATGE